MKEEIKQLAEQKIYKFLRELDFELDITDYVDVSDIVEGRSMYRDIEDGILDDGINHIEVIYYASAMDYLRDNDTSLTTSLGLAEEMGCSIENVNSELLATLLQQKNAREALCELQGEIDDFLQEVYDWLDEEEEEEEDE